VIVSKEMINWTKTTEKSGKDPKLENQKLERERMAPREI
jgi:hypothetical protein